MQVDEVVELDLVARLVGLSRADWKFADLYLRDARTVLSPVLSREQFEGLLQLRRQVPALARALRLAIERADWKKVEGLAKEGAGVRDRLEKSTRLLALGEAVYGKWSLEPHPTALALSGVVSQPASALKRDLSDLGSKLQALAAADTPGRSLYRRRAADLDRAVLEVPEDAPPRIDPAELREAALHAADGSDFSAVLRLARSAARSGQDRLGRIRAPLPASGWVERLAAGFPSDAVERGRRLGLQPGALEPESPFNAYLSCCCAERMIFPSAPLAEAQRELEACTCGHACPPEVGKNLKASLDALMVHPFVTSGGTRYLPWFGAETLLVESFSEDEPDASSGLLEALGLSRRVALPRLVIEDALLSKGPDICAELGLDPIEYRLCCIPFDAYQRLAPRAGWGRRQLWTHFDGYQVTRDLHLQALVGGDVRFGGADDLCGVGRGYDSNHITARFVVVRRDRFEAREAER